MCKYKYWTYNTSCVKLGALFSYINRTSKTSRHCWLTRLLAGTLGSNSWKRSKTKKIKLCCIFQLNWSPQTQNRPQTCTSAFLGFLFLLWNNVQLHPKLLDQLEFCRAVFLMPFSHSASSMNIFVRSLSFYTLCIGNLVCSNVSHISLGDNIRNKLQHQISHL